MNFNTGYPKATLETVNITDFLYLTSEKGVKSIAPTLTGKWAPIWNSEDKGEIRVSDSFRIIYDNIVLNSSINQSIHSCK